MEVVCFGMLTIVPEGAVMRQSKNKETRKTMKLNFSNVVSVAKKLLKSKLKTPCLTLEKFHIELSIHSIPDKLSKICLTRDHIE